MRRNDRLEYGGSGSGVLNEYSIRNQQLIALHLLHLYAARDLLTSIFQLTDSSATKPPLTQRGRKTDCPAIGPRRIADRNCRI